MSFVFVVDTNRHPLDPVHPGRARLLLKEGKAAVLKRYPCTIVLTTSVEQPQLHPVRLKLDPGSKTTGIALVDDQRGTVLFAAELSHRGAAIKKALDGRRAIRRGRRARKTRYRKPRFDNRRRKAGWLAPSLESRVFNVLTWVGRLRALCPITAISMELVRFDLQQMEHPEIAGMHYQQGTLAGYEVREFLLEKWGRTCSYCGKKDTPLQVEHIAARARGGSDRVSNLCLACEPCNQRKGTQDIAVFLAKKPDLLKKIQAQAKAPLKDAAAVNSTRWTLFKRLEATGLPVECGSGGRTKFNRVSRGLEKAHWLDASCVGASTPEVLQVGQVKPLLIEATGHGRRQMCLSDRYGFPRTSAKKAKKVKNFQTGDLVRAVVTKGKKRGTYTGRVAVRATGSFNITTSQGTVQGIGSQYCQMLHQSDGYRYTVEERAEASAFLSSPCLKAGVSRKELR
ncbi:MAG: RRXRR domain-containing protein [Ktedonobacteraceae bacterium]|nr:RRXRR domain-containing protein [Ktedonobacteraceae bacterium]